MRNPFKKKKIEESVPVRPRFGRIRQYDGEIRLIVFHQSDIRPNLFIAKYADTEKPVKAHVGDKISVDVIGAGQSITFMTVEDDDDDD